MLIFLGLPPCSVCKPRVECYGEHGVFEERHAIGLVKTRRTILCTFEEMSISIDVDSAFSKGKILSIEF